MSTRKISWEIVLAGITFVAIAIYMIGRNSEGGHSHPHSAPPAPPPAAAHLPSTIVIDLQHLENLKNLEELKHLKNIENLEIELKNLDKIIEEKINTAAEEESIEKSLRVVEEKLRQIEKTDFRISLQNKKVYISKDYDVKESDWTEISPGVYIFQKSFPVSDLKEMNLDMEFGNLNIIGRETTSGELTVRATGRVGSAKEIRERLSIIDDTKPGSATFSIISNDEGELSRKINLEATLSAPGNVIIKASTNGGHINANNLSGTSSLSTLGGHIMLDAVSGNTTAESNGGHITCDQLNGKATLKTSGGHIRVSHADADLLAKTGGGHIEIEDFRGQVEAKTSGGNISADIRSANGPLSFITSAGNISLVIPTSLSANLDAKGNRVTLDSDLQFDGDKSKGHISGTLNGGGIPLTLVCKYGNVSITDE